MITRLKVDPNELDVSGLLDRYVALVSHDWSPSTLKQVPSITAALLEHLGDPPICDLRLRHIDAAYASMRTAGVSAGTVRRRHGVLHAALAYAVRWEIIAANPATGAEVGESDVRGRKDLPDMAAVSNAVQRLKHPRLRIAAVLALATGARRGELVGLRWRDVDVDAVTFSGSVAVGPDGLARRGLKAGHAKVVAIDPVTVADLRRWRKASRVAALQMGHRMVKTDPVLCSPSDPSAPWHPERITRIWCHARDGIGLPGLRWHDLRHLHATHLLAAGQNPVDVAARLGHASTRMTMDVYAHAIPARDRDAADVIGRARAT